MFNPIDIEHSLKKHICLEQDVHTSQSIYSPIHLTNSLARHDTEMVQGAEENKWISFTIAGRKYYGHATHEIYCQQQEGKITHRALTKTKEIRASKCYPSEKYYLT